MILLTTNERDLTSDYIILELERRNLPFFRLNSEKLSGMKVSFRPELGEDSWVIETDDVEIKFAEVKAAYFRRPGTPTAPASVTQVASARYCETEWGAVLTSGLNSLGDRWLNSPLTIMAAENKPRQLALALECGFKIPSTLITNNHLYAREFTSKNPSIAKPIREALLDDVENERVIFTNRISEITNADIDAITVVPIILQSEITKKSDIRATVIGENVYAAEILSQTLNDTKTDWRRGSHADLTHHIHQLPNDIENQCVQIVKSLGLRFGAVDLVLDLSGAYWFLEINPNGQWAWIESRTGHPLSSAIVDELERIATCS